MQVDASVVLIAQLFCSRSTRAVASTMNEHYILSFEKNVVSSLAGALLQHLWSLRHRSSFSLQRFSAANKRGCFAPGSLPYCWTLPARPTHPSDQLHALAGAAALLQVARPVTVSLRCMPPLRKRAPYIAKGRRLSSKHECQYYQQTVARPPTRPTFVYACMHTSDTDGIICMHAHITCTARIIGMGMARPPTLPSHSAQIRH